MGFPCLHVHCNYLVGARSTCRTPSFAGGMLFLGMFIISNFNLEAAKFSIPLVVIFAIIEIIVDISCRWKIIEWFIRKILWIYGFLLAIRLIHERKKEGTR